MDKISMYWRVEHKNYVVTNSNFPRIIIDMTRARLDRLQIRVCILIRLSVLTLSVSVSLEWRTYRWNCSSLHSPWCARYTARPNPTVIRWKEWRLFQATRPSLASRKKVIDSSGPIGICIDNTASLLSCHITHNYTSTCTTNPASWWRLSEVRTQSL